MNKSQLIELLTESPEDEIYILNEDGEECEIEVEHIDETFDGFYTSFPAHIVLKSTQN